MSLGSAPQDALPSPSDVAAQPQMTKPFSQCSLPDLAYEISLSARAAASLLLPRLADKKQVTAVLQRHPRVRGASGLVCTGTAENRQAWCSMLRDLSSASGAAVSDAVLLRVYNACKNCARLGRVRISDAAAVGPVGGAVADISGAACAAQAKAQPPPASCLISTPKQTLKCAYPPPPCLPSPPSSNFHALY